MSKQTVALAAIVILFACICSTPTWAGVPRVVVCEDFGYIS